MFLSRAALSLNAISRVPGALQIPQSAGVAVQLLCSARSSPVVAGGCRYSAASAGTPQPPLRWTTLDPELEEVLVPRKLSLSPLESWLSLRYSLPPLQGAEQPQQQPPLGDGAPEGGSRVLPPAVEPVLGGEEGEGTAAVTPLSCKNVLEIRRRKMNRHKYKKLMKRTTFLRRKVMEGRRKRKQIRFERDLKRIWTRAGLKSAPEGWSAPKIYVRQYQSKKD
ncbi:aurora kinase A-interacting protein isoform X2 [Anguilla anguilla]|uniref:aurora kinase A-interacting protein isoform X1 n=1 Tax=Anguilla anguilla TaxID=7936 RepID=UPI0015A79ED1|nr:aurora kinase A-interacting protein isoform X1 [Anguilla anguilla]XP_035236876.1 aurora kinase A-interacting protein isoform X2 [Anguilla anguilla]